MAVFLVHDSMQQTRARHAGLDRRLVPPHRGAKLPLTEGMHGDMTVGTHVDRPTGSQASCTKKFCVGF